ncbi:MAG: trigger factor [Saprospiraceae bacterium]|jgi:trigger factor
MNIEKHSVDNLNATIIINISKDDYQSQFKSELSKTAAKAQMKGFRKGKTPLSVVKKMYGKGILADAVNNTLQTALSDYLKSEELDILGQPIPSDDQDGDLDFDVNNLLDYEFKFDIGMSPEVDVLGVSDSDSYDIDKIKIDDKTIDEELNNAQKRLGEQSHPDGAVLAGDIIKIQADELDGKKQKENGWASEFSVLVDSLTDKYNKEVLKLSKDDSFTFDVNEIEKDKGEDYVRKYLLNVPKVEEGEEEPVIGNMFTGKIIDIARLVKAELNQEFYDKYFGEGAVSSDKEAREKVEENIGLHYQNQALQLMYRDIMDKLVADTKVQLPETFLRKWLQLTNEKLSAEEIDKDFPGFLDNMKWTLIKSELAKKFEIEVSPEDIREAMTAKVRSYFGQYGQQMDDTMLNEVMGKMFQNQEEVNKTYEELQAGRVFQKIGEVIKQKEVTISLDDFNAKVKSVNEKQPAQG